MGAEQETRGRIQSVEKPEAKVPIALRGIINGTVFSAEDISGYKFSPEQKSKLRAIEEKIVELTPKFFRIARRAVAVGAIIAIGNYYQTHPDLDRTIDENGQTVYTHEDARTTHYLNILAGRERFTEEDLEAERRPAIMDKLREESIPTPNNIEEMSIDEVYTLYYKNTDPSKIEKPDGFKELNRQWIQMINDQNTLYRSASKDKNSLVWQLEEECGNPQIRFLTEEHLIFVSPKFEDENKYDPVSNTVYLTSGSFLDPRKGFMPEMSHAKQFSNRPIRSYAKILRDYISVAVAGKFNFARAEEEYDLLYKKPGSIEHEAHEIIKPDLERKYPLP